MECEKVKLYRKNRSSIDFESTVLWQAESLLFIRPKNNHSLLPLDWMHHHPSFGRQQTNTIPLNRFPKSPAIATYRSETTLSITLLLFCPKAASSSSSSGLQCVCTQSLSRAGEIARPLALFFPKFVRSQIHRRMMIRCPPNPMSSFTFISRPASSMYLIHLIAVVYPPLLLFRWLASLMPVNGQGLSSSSIQLIHLISMKLYAARDQRERGIERPTKRLTLGSQTKGNLIQMICT